MRIAILICILFSSSFAIEEESSKVELKLDESYVDTIEKSSEVKFQLDESYADAIGKSSEVDFELDESYVDDLIGELERLNGTVTTAWVDEFVDRLLVNIGIFGKGNGLDPMVLEGFDNNFLLARVTLSDGLLSGISDITRNNHVVLEYESGVKLLKIKVPIEFNNINFKYKFRVLLLLIGHSGRLSGQINHLRFNLEISFDFKILKAKLNKLSMMNTGHISLHVDGGIVEVVLTILSELVTTIIHPLIVGITQGVIKSVIETVLHIINDSIDHILHPNSTMLAF